MPRPKWLLLVFALLYPPPSSANNFYSLSESYAANDVTCQNRMGSGWENSCARRDIEGQQLINIGAYLCGRRTWYPSKSAARDAGCQ